MIYVFAIVDGREGVERSAAGIAGFGGAPLRALTQGGLAAVYSDDCPPGLEPTEESLWLHERVLEELMKEFAVLPLRFASTLKDEAELRGVLSSREGEFVAALDAVRGHVEIGVRASAPPTGAGPIVAVGQSGRAYLAAKLDRRRVARRMGEDLHAELAPLARASTARLIADPRPSFAGAYLVERERVDEFRRKVEAARAARPGVAVACTGPWPPFSFTEPLEAA